MEPHLIAVLVLDGVVPFDLGTATQLFGAARDDRERPLYRIRVCSPDARPVQASAGFRILTGHGLEELDRAGTVVVPGVHDPNEAILRGTLDPAIGTALTRAARTARIMSICTGAFVLAAAGLLDDRPATTHWRYAERFRTMFPRVGLDPDVLFVDDGDVLTSAGVGAGVDLCLHVIRGDHGTEAGNRTARRCVMPPWRPGGQSQYIERPVPSVSGASTAPAREWALAHLDERLDLRSLAAQARMSVRTFTRRFREETGVSPGRWIARQRVERARHLLESTDLPVDLVARHSGFGTGAALRQQMAAVLGVAPSAYRGTFRSAGHAPARRG
ncbi:GlxA family transcriptional regulator [Planomonospora venezuelensis]|uniref:Transcriptional regulator GlxA family with amidase domain n=1 Tax=Planomonospora venezuelensis TaxID=1999 RepID=A0A841CZR7_PLAVE|nr:helix-turn-helix domain-containing protein [Planomonospora venezuelensis]MBB5961794.1 transcriptional regulator GlxA family with amidase domain [Planomonospora venezuelensis]GIM99530.1 AraC family transcriptional regulator [Planomonospora venezuelensis]